MAVKALRTWLRGVDAADAEPLLPLHRELWLDHDARGGMPASNNELIWAAYGDQLARQLAGRMGCASPGAVFDGRVGHLVAEHDGALVGQVEVYLDRHGLSSRTPHVAELRSLIVTQRARGLGLGASLVSEAAAASRARAGGSTLVVAEVLARNEALRFYERLGFRTLERLTAIAVAPEPRARISVKAARPRDAGEVAVIDLGARQRRHALGDTRFDAPNPSIGGDLVRIFADGISLDDAARGVETGRLREELIARDDRGNACGAAYLTSATLGPPFADVVRAEVARLAVDPRDPRALEITDALLQGALGRAHEAGAVELLVRTTYLDPIGAHVAGLPGARPFSWILVAASSTILRHR